jgi:hypothetical protein
MRGRQEGHKTCLSANHKFVAVDCFSRDCGQVVTRSNPMDAIATILSGVLIAYVAIGLIAGLALVVAGAVRLQAASVTIGARILLLPGATALWPLVLARWFSTRRIPWDVHFLRRSRRAAY